MSPRKTAALALTLLICAVAFAVNASTQAKRPKISGVAHMALYVSDIQKARAFYGDWLGYQEPYDLKNADGSLSMTFFKINEDQYIEIFPGLKPEQDRLNHIAFQTDDAEALRVYLAAQGIKTPDKVNKVRIGNTSFNVKDADDHTVEFTQYEANGFTRQNKGKALGANRISTRMMHVGVIIGDATAANKFYNDVLGLREFWRGSARDATTVSWMNMRLPDSQDYVEYMLYTELPAPTKRGSQHHICLEVPDIEKALKQLEAHPYRKEYTRLLEIRTGINRRRQLNLFDADGTRVELMEPYTFDRQPAPATTLPLPKASKQ